MGPSPTQTAKEIALTLNEFKAWFDGFSEGIEKIPTERQWAKIKSKMKEIDDTPTSYPIFVDRYVQPYRRWFDTYGPTWSSTDATIQNVGITHILDENYLAKFDIGAAMYVAGQAEASSLTA
jgi:hypothetical protein